MKIIRIQPILRCYTYVRLMSVFSLLLCQNDSPEIIKIVSKFIKIYLYITLIFFCHLLTVLLINVIFNIIEWNAKIIEI